MHTDVRLQCVTFGTVRKLSFWKQLIVVDAHFLKSTTVSLFFVFFFFKSEAGIVICMSQYHVALRKSKEYITFKQG